MSTRTVRREGFLPFFRYSAGLLLMAATSAAGAQFISPADSDGIRFGESRTRRYQVGVILTATGGPCRGLFATVPVPTDWPEQDVRIVDEDITPEVRDVAYRSLSGGVKQMLVDIPRLNRGVEARALVTFEVHRRQILPPDEPSQWTLPQRISRDLRPFLGPSPYIESRHSRIRALARELFNESEATDWQRVESVYDYVREAVQYREGPLKGAVQALNDGYGDCEELTSLFIAICRAAGVPARTVWIPGHCYPEFYLVDNNGAGRWFPCQVAGDRAFGEMTEDRPVLQKGDNFRVPEKPRDRQRYVAEFLRGLPGQPGARPRVKFVRELLP